VACGSEPGEALIMRNVAVIALMSVLVAACSPNMPVLTLQTEANMIANLREGRAGLQCGSACSGTWDRSLSALNRRYVARDWRELAALVMQIGYQNDLAYYYLGRSAEGLGAFAAALKYYRTAGHLVTGSDSGLKCNSGGHDLCNGLNFPHDLYASIRIVERHVSSGKPSIPDSPQAVEASAGGVGSTPGPAPAEKWIDPPPVTR
jgi:hypothetical protein